MKFKIVALIVVLSLLLICGFSVQGTEGALPEESSVADSAASESELLAVRLQNMLNHNYVYNDDFDSSNVMIDNAMLALIENSDSDGYIEADLVEGFIYNMYGISLLEYTPVSDFEQREGYVYLIPRGYDAQNHEILSVEIDGSFVHTDSVMTLTSHEGFTYEFNCRSIFVKADSAFGYNIVSSIYY